MADLPTAPKDRCLCLDIETARTDSMILREIGAYRPDLDVRARLGGKDSNLVRELDRLSEGATFVLGHNVVAFDQPALAILYPGLALHRLPLIDTLELSPIAFPKNPYHRLVKDYKLCTTTRNDPVRDAELAYELFVEQCEALRCRVEEHPDEMLCLHFLLAPENGRGIASLFSTLRHALKPSPAETSCAWQQATAGKVCITGQRYLLKHHLPDPQWHKALAYVLAWLRVAGGNSVLPPWVRLNFPRTREAIALLRDTPCTDPACSWCREQHDLATLLPRYFPGITQFRSSPATADGHSLQRAMVENGFSGHPSLAILPTGGGKSLCFQLPALARYYRNGSLTVVISPLQSLMKDQVDSLVARGITCAGYLNGLLNPLERRVTLDKLRLGDLGLIFVAPEQFRSTAFANALKYREIGAWVFDEAHCLSKWGHDFRPDYLYVSQFVKTLQTDKPSPVFCFTATAKPDVVDDICNHFQQRLGIALQRLEGGVERKNLRYEVQEVAAAAKFGAVLQLLRETMGEEGGAIVFCARQKTAEDLALFLRRYELDCGYFHGDMQPTEKRAVQEAFLAGTLRVIAATNAFGMGVDKPDVRLVIHLDTPGSLENYLQEAGRAGRDQAPARCILLYDDADLDVQFRLLKNSRLSQHDIYAILKALRAIERKDRSEGEVVVTSGEILLEIPETQRIDPDANDADTKVRIAVAWLEEARLLKRHENYTRVFPGSLLVASIEEAGTRLRKKLGPAANSEPYLTILSALMQADDDKGISTDELLLATGADSPRLQQMLRELDRWRLLSNDTEIGVTFYRDPHTSTRLTELARIEDALLASLREAAPDADQGSWQILNVRRLCDTLKRDTGVDLDPNRLARLLKSFAEPFGAGSANRGMFALHPQSADSRRLKLLRDWQDIETIRTRRMRLAHSLVEEFQRHRKNNAALVTCPQGELEAALQADTTLADLDIQRWDVALSSALLYLDANEVLHLTHGKAVFRSAMKIELNPDARRRQFKKSDYAELALHYKDKIVQVHVMAEYARLAIGKIQAAMDFILDYFRLERNEFVRRYFAGRKDVLELATTETAHRRILTDLANPDQQAIVAAPLDGNHLVLAGPGSGKTRVIVHRVAWLLRECMVLPQAIIVLAYNRSAANEIRRRLWALVGTDAAGVSVQTLHGLAMRLTGTSYAVAIERGEAVDFGAVIRQATLRLRTSEEEQSEGDGLSTTRDRLLAGLRFMLVDEYQDINGDHYDLISAVAGRTLQTAEDRIWLMVVGDDDQNIYAFDGASVRYIRQFQSDYAASRFSLIENYRSTQQIIDCANRIIERARERMKVDQAIRVNHARREHPRGGELEALDPLLRGRVHVLEVPRNPNQAVQVAFDELSRLHALLCSRPHEDGSKWGRFAVIARRWEDLEPMHALCRLRGIPVTMLRDGGQINLHLTREGYLLLSLLSEQQRQAKRKRLLVRAGALSRWFRRRFHSAPDGHIEHPFRAALGQFIHEIDQANPRGQLLVDDLVESLYDFGSASKARGSSRPNAPLLLTTAHRAKGLEFDHVLILDGGGWQGRSDDERRLFYVAMTRARLSLTLCATLGGQHPFIDELQDLTLHSHPEARPPEPGVNHRTWVADPEKIILSWPGYFRPDAPIHRAIAALDVGSPLLLRPRSDGNTGWELADVSGSTVGRMSSKFQRPDGEIVTVRVAAILVRRANDSERKKLSCTAWELVLPEIEYRPAPSAPTSP